MSGLVGVAFALPFAMVEMLVKAAIEVEREVREDAVRASVDDVREQIDSVAEDYRKKLQQLRDELAAGGVGADPELLDRFSKLIDSRVREFRQEALGSMPIGSGLDALAYANELSMNVRLRAEALRRELALALPNLVRESHREAEAAASQREVQAVDTLEQIRLQQLAKKAGYSVESRTQVDIDELLEVLTASSDQPFDGEPERDLAQAYFQWAETVISLLSDDAVGTKRQAALSQQFSEIQRAFDAANGEGGYLAEKNAFALLDSTKALLNDARHHADVMRELYDRYVELVACLAKKDPSTPVRDIETFEDENELEAALGACESRLAQMLKDEYVAQALDEVMAAHGYSTKHAIVLESGAMRDLYLSDRSDAAVSVGTEGDRVFMLTAKADASEYDDADGQPVEASLSPITDTVEKNRQYHAQQHFCTVYDEIVKELAERGITLSMGPGDQRVPASPDASLEIHRRGHEPTPPASSEARRMRDSRTASTLAEREMK